MLILNLAAGKLKPLLTVDEMQHDHLVVNLDTSYYSYMDPDLIEDTVDLVKQNGQKGTFEYYCKEDAFEFMERTRIVFDRVCIYRFLEHVSFDRLNYFIYLLSTITEPPALIDVIVPNYNILAKMIQEEDVYAETFEADNILLTTELLNEPGCPHASIWTTARAKKFFELEGRFDVIDWDTNFDFDGRDIYLRFKARRI
jgi:hypothetical protein